MNKLQLKQTDAANLYMDAIPTPAAGSGSRLVPPPPSSSFRFFPALCTEQEWIPIPFLFHFSGINHIDHIINGDRCFCNVGRDDDFDNSCRRAEEHRLLFFTGQRRMKGINNTPGGKVREYAQHFSAFFLLGTVFLHALLHCHYQTMHTAIQIYVKNGKLPCHINFKTCPKGGLEKSAEGTGLRMGLKKNQTCLLWTVQNIQFIMPDWKGSLQSTLSKASV